MALQQCNRSRNSDATGDPNSRAKDEAATSAVNKCDRLRRWKSRRRCGFCCSPPSSIKPQNQRIGMGPSQFCRDQWKAPMVAALGHGKCTPCATFQFVLPLHRRMRRGIEAPPNPRLNPASAKEADRLICGAWGFRFRFGARMLKAELPDVCSCLVLDIRLPGSLT